MVYVRHIININIYITFQKKLNVILQIQHNTTSRCRFIDSSAKIKSQRHDTQTLCEYTMDLAAGASSSEPRQSPNWVADLPQNIPSMLEKSSNKRLLIQQTVIDVDKLYTATPFEQRDYPAGIVVFNPFKLQITQHKKKLRVIKTCVSDSLHGIIQAEIIALMELHCDINQLLSYFEFVMQGSSLPLYRSNSMGHI